jgi:hypothetical protein
MLALFTIQYLSVGVISALFTQSSSVEKKEKMSSGLGFRVGAQTCNICNGIEYRRERAISRTRKTGSDFVAEGGLLI